MLWRATRWRSFSLLPPALWVLAATLLAATIIHEDRFKWDYPLTWVWAFVYAGVPLAIPFLVARQRRVAAALPAADPALGVLRMLSGIAGAGLIAGAAALYVAPVELGEYWLWALTPLLARAVAAWYALFGTMLLTFALAQRRPFEGLIGYATLAALVRAAARAAARARRGRERRLGVVRADGRAAGSRPVWPASRVAGARPALRPTASGTRRSTPS